MFGFDERDMLEAFIATLTVGYFVKGSTFARLAWAMFRSEDRTSLGSALRWHYTSLTAQSIPITIIFFYYWTLVHGFESWLNTPQRVGLYIAATVSVLWAAVMGFRLLIAYWLATRSPEEGGEAS